MLLVYSLSGVIRPLPAIHQAARLRISAKNGKGKQNNPSRVSTDARYVNMADINLTPGPVRMSRRSTPQHGQSQDVHQPDDLEDDLEFVKHIELLFFAYRDFTGEPDALLDDFGFGRAHHRVLHFVHRNPGLRVADLLDILKITKQSLARVLKQLIDEGFITQEAGVTDRRERLLYVTSQGRSLANQLLELQSERIRNAMADAGPNAEAVVAKFLLAVVSPEDRRTVTELVLGHENVHAGNSDDE